MWNFASNLIEEIGVATIPPSAFFSAKHRHHAENHVRFAFCKSDETLERAAERMRQAARLSGHTDRSTLL